MTLGTKLKRLFASRSGQNTARGHGHDDQAYRERVQAERNTFSDQLEVHELPDIFHYWSNRYLRPMNEALGFSHPEHFFEVWLGKVIDGISGDRPARFVSLGSGNCDAEVRMAQALRASGYSRFIIECIDINPAMLQRGRELAEREGLSDCVKPTEGDFNHWRPRGRFDAVIANQALHHVLELEDLFAAIAKAIGKHGLFITSDMIGRNGHMRWPESRELVQAFWQELPDAYRYNQQLKRQEDEFMDWDCSGEGFEGIRAQDILPLLIERFGFRMFLAYANVIDPFVDRSFGHNFDAEGAWDRDFIDRVHACDEEAILAGRVKPTHMLAVLCNDRRAQPRIREHLTPAFCVRPPDGQDVAA